MVEATPVYLYRQENVGVCAAPSELVARAFGGGGHWGDDGVRATFGRSFVWRDDGTSAYIIGVWRSRLAARFLAGLRRTGAELTIVPRAPPARLMLVNGPSRMSRRSRYRLEERIRTAEQIKGVSYFGHWASASKPSDHCSLYRRAQRTEALARFVHDVGRTSRGNQIDPNNRAYDPHFARSLRRMPPEEFDRLLRDDED